MKMKVEIVTLHWKKGYSTLFVNYAESIKGVESYENGVPKLVRAEYLTPFEGHKGEFVVNRDLWDLSEMTDESRELILSLIKEGEIK